MVFKVLSNDTDVKYRCETHLNCTSAEDFVPVQTSPWHRVEEVLPQLPACLGLSVWGFSTSGGHTCVLKQPLGRYWKSSHLKSYLMLLDRDACDSGPVTPLPGRLPQMPLLGSASIFH